MKKFLALTMILMFGLLIVPFARSQYPNSANIRIEDVRYDPNPVKSGNYMDLFITVSNKGLQAAENLNLELVTDYPFSLDPNQNATKRFVRLNGLDSITINYKVRIDSNAIEGDNELKLKYWEGTETDPDSYTSMSFNVFVESSSNLIVSEVKPTTINPGSQIDIIFTLSNVGNAPIRNLLFEWNDPNNLILPIGSDNRKYVQAINVGEETDVYFKIMADPNLAPGVYPLTIKLTNDKQNATTTKVGLIVGGGTDFDVNVDSSSDGELSLSISNTGVNNAESVSVKMGNKAMILGKLNKGDFTLATFSNPILSETGTGITGQVTNRGRNTNETQSRNLPIEIAYTDTTGQRQTVTKQISLSPSFSSSARNSETTVSGRLVNRSNNNFFNILIVVVIAIAAIGGFYFYRKRKKEKDEI